MSAKDTMDYLLETGVPRECIYYGEDKAHGEMMMHDGEEFKQIVDWLILK